MLALWLAGPGPLAVPVVPIKRTLPETYTSTVALATMFTKISFDTVTRPADFKLLSEGQQHLTWMLAVCRLLDKVAAGTWTTALQQLQPPDFPVSLHQPTNLNQEFQTLALAHPEFELHLEIIAIAVSVAAACAPRDKVRADLCGALYTVLSKRAP